VPKMDDKTPTLRKIKRAESQRSNQRFCSTFNFAQPHPKPTQHPTSGQLIIWTGLWAKKNIKTVSCRLEKMNR